MIFNNSTALPISTRMWQRANAINLVLLSIFTLIIIALIGVHHLPLTIVPFEIDDKKQMIEEVVLESATGTTKDLWANKNGKRFHYHLESPSTKVIMKHDLNKTSYYEEMDDMRLWMQDRFLSSSKPSQQVRFIQAPHSIFDFSQQKLKTENTFMALYTTPGEILSLYLKPEQITLRGKADSFDLKMEKDGAHFSAKGFKAQINEPGEDS